MSIYEYMHMRVSGGMVMRGTPLGEYLRDVLTPPSDPVDAVPPWRALLPKDWKPPENVVPLVIGGVPVRVEPESIPTWLAFGGVPAWMTEERGKDLFRAQYQQVPAPSQGQVRVGGVQYGWSWTPGEGYHVVNLDEDPPGEVDAQTLFRVVERLQTSKSSDACRKPRNGDPRNL